MTTLNELKKIIILGSTGSVGINTLSVIKKNPLFEVHAITGNDNYKLLAKNSNNGCLKFPERIMFL